EQAGDSRSQVSDDKIVDGRHGRAGKVVAWRGHGHIYQGHVAPERGQEVVGVGAVEARLGTDAILVALAQRSRRGSRPRNNLVAVVDGAVGPAPHHGGRLVLRVEQAVVVIGNFGALHLARNGHVGAFLHHAE
nr:hypothetical protein [Tanacetum cinerariifolium]